MFRRLFLASVLLVTSGFADSAPVTPEQFAKTARGTCGDVYVETSAYPGYGRVYAQPTKSEEAKYISELFFCGGPIAHCAQFAPGFDWVKPDPRKESTTAPAEMQMATFIPAANHSVTVLRTTPKADGKLTVCLDEVRITKVNGKDGEYLVNPTESLEHKKTAEADLALVTKVRAFRPAVAAAPAVAAGSTGNYLLDAINAERARWGRHALLPSGDLNFASDISHSVMGAARRQNWSGWGSIEVAITHWVYHDARWGNAHKNALLDPSLTYGGVGGGPGNYTFNGK